MQWTTRFAGDRVRAVPNLKWLNKEVPPLDDPKGIIVNVSTVSELERAVKEVEPGTTIMIEEGIYQLNQTLVLNKEGITLRGASQDREKVVLLGGGINAERPGPKQIISIETATNITVANLTVKECRIQGIAVQGHTQPHGVHIYNVGFIDMGQRSIKVNTMPPIKWDERPSVNDGLVEFCYFEQIQDTPPDRDDGFGGDYIGGIDAHRIKGWIIRDNVFLNIRGPHGGGRGAIFIWSDSYDTIVERNLIFGCDRGIAIGNPYVPEGVDEYWYHTGGIVRNNFVYAPKERMAVELVKVRDLKFINNTIYNEDPQFNRNFEYAHPTTRVILKNNLVHGMICSSEGAMAESGCNITAASGDWFADAANGDLRLTCQAAVPKGAGLSLEEVPDDFFGNPRTGKLDIGAHQA